MGKYFGSDGFRGEANVDLTAEHAFRVGLFVAGTTERIPSLTVLKITRHAL